MKVLEILNKSLETINNVSPLLADCINELTNKIIIAKGENIDENGNVIIQDTDNEDINEEMLSKMSNVETCFFNALANLIKAKEFLGTKLEFHEVMFKTQYEYEMSEAMEIYRECRNMEEILNDENKEDKK